MATASVASPHALMFLVEEAGAQGPSLSRPILHSEQRPRAPQAVVGGAHRPETALVTEYGDALAALLVDLLHACGPRGLPGGPGQRVSGPPRLLAPIAEFAVGQRPEPARIAVPGRTLAADLGPGFACHKSRCHRGRQRFSGRELGHASGRPARTPRPWPLCARALVPRFHLLAHGRHSSSGASTNPSPITAPNPRLSFAIGPSAAHGAAGSTAACQAGPGSLH